VDFALTADQRELTEAAGGRYRYLTEGAQVENVTERFGIMVGEADLVPRNFATVNTMCAYLRTRQPGRQEAAHE
jgi:hypothetical protein